MALYDSLFGLMDCQAAQILVTSNDFADADFRKNLSATTEDLLSMNVVPVFNENDAISSRTAAEVVRSRLTSDSFVGVVDGAGDCILHVSSWRDCLFAWRIASPFDRILHGIATGCVHYLYHCLGVLLLSPGRTTNSFLVMVM